MKIGVRVMPKDEVLDSQGRAVEKVLKTNGFEIKECRVGKYIEIEVDANSESEALEKVKKVADYVLYNPLIENYSLEVSK